MAEHIKVFQSRIEDDTAPSPCPAFYVRKSGEFVEHLHSMAKNLVRQIFREVPVYDTFAKLHVLERESVFS
jgi:hypothetical protein